MFDARSAIVVTLFVHIGLGCGGSSSTNPDGIETGPSGDALTPWRYRLQLAEGTGESIAMTMWLPRSDEPRAVDLPALPGREARRSQIRDLVCDDEPVERAAEGWTLPDGCGTLSWRVVADEVPLDGVDPGALRVVWNAGRGWWFLPGAALFLHPAGMDERPAIDLRMPDGVEVHHGLPETTMGFTLPPPAQLGRVILGAGRFHEEFTEDGRARIYHYFDDTADVDLPRLALAQRYIQTVTGASTPPVMRVFWFGHPMEAVAPPGAAGLDAITAAYYRADESVTEIPPMVRFGPIVSLLEQQFVVLTHAQIPDWASESLGRLYAVRALNDAGGMDDAGYEAWLSRSISTEPPEPAVLRMDVRSTEQRRARIRAAVGFWHAVDQTLPQEGGGLDAVLPELLGLIYQRDGSPPQRFVTVLTEAGSENAVELSRAWLGFPE